MSYYNYGAWSTPYINRETVQTVFEPFGHQIGFGTILSSIRLQLDTVNNFLDNFLNGQRDRILREHQIIMESSEVFYTLKETKLTYVCLTQVSGL